MGTAYCFVQRRIRRLHNNNCMGGFCSKCMKNPEMDTFQKIIKTEKEKLECYKAYYGPLR